MKISLRFGGAFFLAFACLRALFAQSPQLSLEQVEAHLLRISWSGWASDFRLEETDALSSATAWHLSQESPQFSGEVYFINISATNVQRYFRLRYQAGPEVPPDPASVAPPYLPSGASSIGGGTAFLYSGADPIQTGVTAGTIEARRAVILRGELKLASGAALPAATISIEGHPEYGQTLSRADGKFDLAVNGGGSVVLSFRKSGYIDSTRVVTVPWQEYVFVAPVTLLAQETKSTVVPLTGASAAQLAQGSQIQDERGARRATVFFPAGVSAAVLPAAGQTQTVNQLTVRLTEFTVGTNGPSAMPLELPSGVAYTYAVNLGADEAQLKVGGKDVLFSQPVYYYVDNFLKFPAGLGVPVAYVDPDRGAWVPSQNGLVIQLLGVNAQGLVNVDTNGDGAPEDSAALAASGFTDEERRKLATAYAPNQSLWRVPMTHFSKMDLNFPFYFANDQKPEMDPLYPSYDQATENHPNTTGSYGEVELENLAFREALPLAGVPFALHYTSQRVEGFAPKQLHVPVTPETLPEALTGVEVEIRIAGRMFKTNYPPVPNLVYDFAWDGRDVYGREVFASQPAVVEIAYLYPVYYAKPPPAGTSFGLRSFEPIEPRVRVKQDASVVQKYVVNFRSRSVIRAQALAGWSLSVHHLYDPSSQTLYLGTGEARNDPNVQSGYMIETFAGNGAASSSGSSEGPATGVPVVAPWSVAAVADGSIIIGAAGVHKVDPQGRLIHLPQMQTTTATAVAAGPDGSIYVGRDVRRGIVRIHPAGAISAVVGSNDLGFAGDDGPALNALMSITYGLAVAPDGTVYFSDMQNHRVRRIGPDGTIQTVAGSGPGIVKQGSSYILPKGAFGGDEGPGASAQLNEPRGLALARDGSLFIADAKNHRIRKLTPDGMITTVAGNGGFGPSNDGLPAVQSAVVTPVAVALSRDETLFFCESGRVRRITREGLVETVAGLAPGALPTSGFSGDGGPATAAKFNGPQGICVGLDGTIYVADLNNNRVRHIRSTFPNAAEAEFLIASEDGFQLFTFDNAGRHLTTFDTLTGARLWEFGYDSNGRLSALIDVDGRRTVIERDNNGRPLAIVAPYGQRTVLGADSNGWLASVANPAGEVVGLEHTAEGLLTKVTGAKGPAYAYRIAYDSLGLAARVDDPGGGFEVFTRNETRTAVELTMTTALGPSMRSQTVSAVGSSQRTVSSSDGSTTTMQTTTSGRKIVTDPSGVRTVSDSGPDPRFGMQAPVLTNVVVTLPSGLSATNQSQRTIGMTQASTPELLTVTNRLSVNGRVATSVYDALTRVTTRTSPSGRQVRTQTDSAGRVTRVETPGLDSLYRLYDAAGRWTNETVGTGALARTTRRIFDSSGNLAAIVDPLGRTNSMSYDLAGRVVKRTGPDGAFATFEFDAHGNLVSVTPPGRSAHRFGYSSVDLPTTNTLPGDGGPQSTMKFFDLDRRVAGILRADGGMLTNIYSLEGRLLRQEAEGESRLYDYSLNGRLAAIRTPSISVSNSFDGTLVTDTAWSGAVNGHVRRTYDNDFRLKTLKIGDGDEIAFDYDPDGLVTQAGTLSLSWSLTNRLLQAAALGQIEESFEHNSRGNILRSSIRSLGQALMTIDYAYDLADRVTEKRESFGAALTIWTYQYDVAGRLREVRQNGSVAAEYSYDSNGNRLEALRPNESLSATLNEGDQLIQVQSDLPGRNVSFRYNASGDLTNRIRGTETTSYRHDVFGNLREVRLSDGRRVSYIIDGGNRRAGKKVNDVLTQGFLFAAEINPVAELDGNNQLVSVFIYASGKSAPDYLVKGGVNYKIVTDQTGSPRLVVNSLTGEVVQRLDFDEFGRVLRDTNPGFQPFGFAGGLYDPATGLVRFGAREYDPESARWLTRDPNGFATGSFNLYEYCLGDPINLSDPAGLGPNWGTVGYGIAGIALGTTTIALNTAAIFATGGTFYPGYLGVFGGGVNFGVGMQNFYNGFVHPEQPIVKLPAQDATEWTIHQFLNAAGNPAPQPAKPSSPYDVPPLSHTYQ